MVGVGGTGVELGVAEAVDPEDLGSQDAVRSGCGAGTGVAGQAGRVDPAAEAARSTPWPVRPRRGEDVPPAKVTPRPTGARAASPTAGGEGHRGQVAAGKEESVVGADQDGAGGGHLDGDRPAGGADPGVDDGEDHAWDQPGGGPPQGEGAGPHVVGGIRWVTSMTGDAGGAGRDDPVDDAHELVLEPVVGEERDRARRGTR